MRVPDGDVFDPAQTLHPLGSAWTRWLVSDATHAARGPDRFPGHPVGIVRGQKNRDRGDVLGLAEAAEGRAGDELLAECTVEMPYGGRGPSSRAKANVIVSTAPFVAE
jgi:hypothetical protein